MTIQTHDVQPVRFSPRRLGHANLFVGDFQKSLHFYRDICGFEGCFRETEMEAALLTNGNTHHDLALIQTMDGTKPVIGRGGHLQIPKGRGIQAGLNHFGWELENEKALVDAYNRAVAAGLNIHRVVDHTVSRSVYVFDPDGYLHEFYADSVKDWWTCFDGHIPGREMTGNWDPNAEPAATDARYHTNPKIKRVAEALIHPLRLTHAVLMTRYFDRMVAFYAEVAGLKLIHTSDDGGLVCLAGPATGYAFDIALSPPGAGLAAVGSPLRLSGRRRGGAGYRRGGLGGCGCRAREEDRQRHQAQLPHPRPRWYGPRILRRAQARSSRGGSGRAGGASLPHLANAAEEPIALRRATAARLRIDRGLRRSDGGLGAVLPRLGTDVGLDEGAEPRRLPGSTGGGAATCGACQLRLKISHFCRSKYFSL